MKYRSGYKYQLAERYDVEIPIRPRADIHTEFIHLSRLVRSRRALLTIKSGYAWDGPSGPVIDTDDTMTASLVHDALYQLMRMRKLRAGRWRDVADKLFKRMCMENGVSRAVAHIFYLGLRIGGRSSASPKSRKTVHIVL